MRRTNKQRQKSKRSRKSRKLRRQTRSRRSKMRGGMNMIPLVKVLAALFAVLKTDPSFKSKDIVYGPKDQLDAIDINREMLQKNINSPTIHEHDGVDIYKLNGLDLNKLIWNVEQEKDLNLILNKPINIEEYKVEPNESTPDVKPEDNYFDAKEF
jgi:hypothetical protein